MKTIYRKTNLAEGRELLSQAVSYFDSLSEMRRERLRCLDYTFGRQWGETMKIGSGYLSESDYIIKQGGWPMKNNLIGRIVRNVLGVFRNRLAERTPAEAEIEQIRKANRLDELYSRLMHEFLISGVAVVRKWFGVRDGVTGIFTDPVSPAKFFYDTGSLDPRGNDISFIGCVNEVSFGEWCSQFVRTRSDYERACALFPHRQGYRCVAEIWRREQRPRRLHHIAGKGLMVCADDDIEIRGSTRSKWFIEDVWRYYFLDNDGYILREGDSPYLSGGHPFIMKLYPYLDGEIHSFVADMIDQQRYTNRLITLYDWILRTSAKGVLLVPENSITPEEMEDVVKEWSRFDGVIRYKAKAGDPEPHQVSGAGKADGVAQLLDIQLKMMEDVSGVTGTLRGNISASSVSGTLYSQQTENALTSLADLLASFNDFMTQSENFDRMLLQQSSK